VTLLEKERVAGAHQSSHNSGVLHAGLYYRPGSHRAKLAVRGIRMMRDYCAAHGLRHETCGKLVVAASDDEVPRLRALFERGQANGLAGLEWLDAAAAREREPHVRAVAAVLVPEEGIADYPAVVAALARELTESGVHLRLGAGVSAIRRDGAEWVVGAGDEEIRTDAIVNCAGLHADRVARMAGERPTVRIVPFRGEYWMLKPHRRHLVRHLVYPVPDPAFPFLGVHFTRTVGGEIECGPNAVLALAREGYRWRNISPRDLFDAATFPGLWRFMARHPRVSAWEIRRSLSLRLFCESLRRLVPEVTVDDLIRGPSGVRAQAMRPDGTLCDDFEFVERPGAVHVLNAPSPAATASLAIGEEIAGRITFGGSSRHPS
jgi:L-2-hydroxyglutarate oxidase